MDLKDYADASGRRGGKRSKCLTCSLDSSVLTQIHAGRAQQPKPISFPVIAEWLKREYGVNLHPNTIRNHFVSEHSCD